VGQQTQTGCQGGKQTNGTKLFAHPMGARLKTMQKKRSGKTKNHQVAKQRWRAIDRPASTSVAKGNPKRSISQRKRKVRSNLVPVGG